MTPVPMLRISQAGEETFEIEQHHPILWRINTAFWVAALGLALPAFVLVHIVAGIVLFLLFLGVHMAVKIVLSLTTEHARITRRHGQLEITGFIGPALTQSTLRTGVDSLHINWVAGYAGRERSRNRRSKSRKKAIPPTFHLWLSADQTVELRHLSVSEDDLRELEKALTQVGDPETLDAEAKSQLEQLEGLTER